MIFIRTFFIFTLSIFCISSSVSFAAPEASIIIKPENPEPNSSVQLSISSYSFNPNTALITWKIGGKVVLQGEGETSLQVTTGNIGEVVPVFVRAETADGQYVEQIINVTPSSIVLAYEAPKSYIPLLYPGRSLPSEGATVRVVAFPNISENGNLVDPSRLSYSWYVDGELVKNYSGRGKRVLEFKLNILKENDEVRVVVSSPLGITGSKTISIQPHPIMPMLYTHDPVFGSNFTQKIGRRFEAVSDFTISLEPFYVSNKEKKDPTYSWYLGGFPSTPIGGRLMTFNPKASSYGSNNLLIKVEGPNKIVQTAEVETELIFDTRK